MAIKELIGPGIGFSPGNVQYIVTRGLGAAAVVAFETPPYIGLIGAESRALPLVGADGRAASLIGAESRPLRLTGAR